MNNSAARRQYCGGCGSAAIGNPNYGLVGFEIDNRTSAL